MAPKYVYCVQTSPNTHPTINHACGLFWASASKSPVLVSRAFVKQLNTMTSIIFILPDNTAGWDDTVGLSHTITNNYKPTRSKIKYQESGHTTTYSQT